MIILDTDTINALGALLKSGIDVQSLVRTNLIKEAAVFMDCGKAETINE